MSIQEIETQRKTHPNFVAAVSDYEFGQNAYLAGWSIDRLASAEEKRGWRSAVDFQSDTDTKIWLAAHPEPYREPS